MDQETLITSAIVLAALFFIGRRVYSWLRNASSGKVGCGSDCGCATEQTKPKH